MPNLREYEVTVSAKLGSDHIGYRQRLVTVKAKYERTAIAQALRICGFGLVRRVTIVPKLEAEAHRRAMKPKKL